MADSDPKSCNRIPFLSDDECSRGLVDIHKFDDFPYCSSFYPTPPEIPPEIPDTPINIPIPPPCVCFDIAYKTNAHYGETFSTKASFSAVSDCCAGRYNTNFDLQIKCPIIGDDTKKIKINPKYKKGTTKQASASYAVIKKGSCEIEVKDVEINLEIPCVFKDGETKKLKTSIKYGNTFKSASVSYAKTTSSCNLELYNGREFKLEIPCPIDKSGNNTKKIKINPKYKKGTTKQASASYAVIKKESCEIEVKDVEINLEIPCVFNDGETKKLKTSIKYGNTFKSASVSYAKTTSSCNLELYNGREFKLEIPCPIDNVDGTIGIKVGWGNGGKIEKRIAEKNSCTLSIGGASFDLQIPCPVKDVSNTAKVSIAYGDGAQSASAAVLEDTGSCGIQTKDATFSLNLPCPVKDMSNTAKVSIAYGTGAQSASAAVVESTVSCGIQTKDVTFALNLPCPVSKEKLSFETSYETQDVDDGTLTVVEDKYEDDCSRTIKLKAIFPRGGGTEFSSCSVIQDIRYFASKHALQVKTINLKTQVISAWKDVFVAINHRSDHTKCNDVK